MAQADVFALIDDISGVRSDGAVLDDTTARARYYADVVFQNGLTREASTNAEFIAVTEATAVYAFPTAAIRLLAVIFDDHQLRPTLRRALEAYDSAWRSRKGTPRSWLTQDEDTRTFRLVPVPPQDGQAIGTSTPFIGAFPAENLTVVYTENVTDVLPWDELWVALEVLSREYGRESDHHDPMFATTAYQLAQLIRAMVGYTGGGDGGAT